jgi:capsular polysaccharide biosynthesis protein
VAVDLQGYLAMVRGRWLVVAAVTQLALAIALIASVWVTPRYESRATVFFSVAVDPSPGSLARGFEYSGGLIDSYKTIATTPFVLEPVIERLDLRTTPARLARSITIRVPNNTVLLEVAVTDRSPQRATSVATAVAEQLAVAAQEITPQLGTQPVSVRGTTVSPAVVPTSASYPYTKLNLALGLVLGLLIGAAAAIASEVWDPRLRNRPQLAQVTTAPMLGTVSVRGRRRVPGGLRRLPGRFRPVSHEDQTVELGANFEHLRAEESLRVVTVTSAADEAVATLTIVDIAASLAKRGTGVLVVDADLRRPTLGKGPGAEREAGLSSLLTEKQDWTDSVQHFAGMPLSVLPSGPPLPDPDAELSSQRAERVLGQLAERYGLVLLKAPPVLRAAEGLTLSALADGTIVVTDRRAMRKRSLVRVLDALDVAGVRVAGVVVSAR